MRWRWRGKYVLDNQFQKFDKFHRLNKDSIYMDRYLPIRSICMKYIVYAELMKMAIGHRAEEGYVLRDFVSPEEEEEEGGGEEGG
jgi:hypothetical protein